MSRQSHTIFSLALMTTLSVIALGMPIAQRPHADSEPALIMRGAATHDEVITAEPLAPPPPVTAFIKKAQTGIASWYGKAWQGRLTASGSRFDTRLLTAAHRSLPLNTIVRVTNLLNGRSVEVVVNDRGPYVGHRVIDLSEAAAKRLDMVKKGLAPVRIETVPPQQQVAMLVNHP